MAWDFLTSFFGAKPAPAPTRVSSDLAAARLSTAAEIRKSITTPVPDGAVATATPAGGESVPAEAAGATPAAETPSVDRPATPRRASAIVVAETPPLDTAALAYSEELRQQVQGALRRLDAAMDDRMRGGDAALFLRELSADPATTIRQLPMAAQKALGLLNQDPSNAQLTAHFERDPSVTQALLHQANGAYYNPSGRRILALGEAIKRLGRSGVRNVLLHQAVQGLVCRPGGEYDSMVTKAWMHMVRTAQVARTVAPAFDVDKDQAFALALLHDAGKLVVFDRIAAMRGRLRRGPVLERALVRRALRLIHEPMGGLGVLAWGLGYEAARAVATHHREPVPAERDLLGEVLFVAERVDIHRQKGQPVDWEGAWSAGQLSGDQDEARRLVESDRSQVAA